MHAPIVLACTMQALPTGDGVVTFGLSRVAGFCLILVWAAVLVGALVLRTLSSYSDHYAQPLHWFETFYRIGSLIYGGGQVVLPMLLTECVQYDCFVDDHGKQVRPRSCALVSMPSVCGVRGATRSPHSAPAQSSHRIKVTPRCM